MRPLSGVALPSAPGTRQAVRGGADSRRLAQRETMRRRDDLYAVAPCVDVPGVPMRKGGSLPPFMPAPASALGFHPWRALSSAQASSVYLGSTRSQNRNVLQNRLWQGINTLYWFCPSAAFEVSTYGRFSGVHRGGGGRRSRRRNCCGRYCCRCSIYHP